MDTKKIDKVNEKLEIPPNLIHIQKKQRKRKIIQFVIYLLNYLTSGLLGLFTPLGVGGVYPYFVLFTAPVGIGIFLTTQIAIGSNFVKSNPNAPRSRLILNTAAIIGSFVSYIFGVYWTAINVPYSTGALYGVYSKRKIEAIVWKKRLTLKPKD